MTESEQGHFVFLAIALASAVIWHVLDRRYVRAIGGATLCAAIGFQVAVYLQLGYLDPFFPVALLVSALAAGFIAALVGLLFLAGRRP
ncbi:hypothetical protein BURK2_03242 [Burkholderiales bacterium]|nr:hypothetical protein BURK2_03242 [Burkholderiales bacterium]